MNEATPQRELKRAKTIAFRLLKIRGRSEDELRGRLRLKKIPGDTVEKTIEYLRNTKLVDDRRFAKDWIDARLNRPFGLRRISLELQKKGIDPEIIKDELARVKINYKESDIVETLARRRSARYTHIDGEKRRKRVFDYLARRGFSLDAIQKAIQKL